MTRLSRCVGLVLVLGLAACASGNREEQILAEMANLDKQAIFDKGEALFAEEEWADARRYFSFVYDTFPNDPLGHKAALRVADTYVQKRDTASLTEARLRYRDFANRYPNDPDRDYALLMVGQTFSSKRLKPDRDLANLHEALSAYEQLLALYPDSEYHDDAMARVDELREILAEHEWITARFYARNQRWLAVQWRLEYLRENYPDYSKMEDVDVLYATAGDEIESARQKFDELMRQRLQKRAEGSPETDAEVVESTTSDTSPTPEDQ
ncbi:MAG: outer membrane protein assembly factor BamD [Alphaproteobacteria bacterium]|nr:outer membrane protein assembly factor BamD [Alphaproteobacteria bacterium]